MDFLFKCGPKLIGLERLAVAHMEVADILVAGGFHRAVSAGIAVEAAADWVALHVAGGDAVDDFLHHKVRVLAERVELFCGGEVAGRIAVLAVLDGDITALAVFVDMLHRVEDGLVVEQDATALLHLLVLGGDFVVIHLRVRSDDGVLGGHVEHAGALASVIIAELLERALVQRELHGEAAEEVPHIERLRTACLVVHNAEVSLAIDLTDIDAVDDAV